MHRVGAKVNATGPFHTAKVGIDGDGVEGVCVQQFQEHAAASLGSTAKMPLNPSLKATFNRQPGNGSAETIRFMSLFYSNGGILEGS